MSWPLVKLADVCNVIMGQAPEGSSYNEVGEGVPLLAGAGDFGEITPTPKKFTTEAGKFSQSGDLILCIRATIGDLNWSDRAYCLGRGVAGLRVIKDKLDASYLWHFIGTHKHELASKGTGSTFKQVNRTHIAEWEVSLPPLPEQKRIAAILDKADAIRRKRQQAIQLADDFLRAVFLEMFGDPVTNPKGWEVRPLSELVSKLGDGLHGTPKYDESGDYYFINGNNLDSGSIVISERVKRVGDEEFKRHKKELTKNTMLVSINGTIGKVAFYQGEKVILGKSVCYFNVIPERISSIYLYHLIGSHHFLRYTSGIETGSTIKNVSLKSMREFPVPVPSANLQSKFEILVKRIESKKTKLIAGHNSAGALFDSLSQSALSGQL